MLNEGLLFAERYKFIKQLGRGGFAEVWLAEDTMTGVEVAVKVYAPGTGLDEAGIKIFTQEFSLVFDMNHTNLLRPTHFDCWERQPYLIMPLCKNGSAFKYVTGTEQITEEQCWNMLHDVAAGLAYLHEKEPPLIHQDIKPDNILINDEGHYMITDFGISARVRSTIRGAQSQEQSGGTLAYMGPERFSANPKPIMASDVWSLGAMMYEIMTCGNPPFGNHGGVLQKNGADIPIIEEDFSQELKDIIYSCLAKETWDRPSARKIEEMTYNKLHGIVMPQENTEAEGVNMQNSLNPMQSSLNPMQNSQNPMQSSFPPGQNSMPPVDPMQTPKRSMPLQKGTGLSKNVKIGIAAAAAVLLLIVCVFVFSGGKEKETERTAEEVVTPVDHTPEAETAINEGKGILKSATDLMESKREQLVDVEAVGGKIEDQFINAIMKFDEVLTADYKDTLSPNIINNANAARGEACAQLKVIYDELMKKAESLKGLGLADAADAFTARANEFKSYINE